MPDTLLWEYGLVAANLVVYSILAIQFLWRMDREGEKASSVSEAFAVLEKAVRNSVLPIPQGFTWREVVTEVKKLKLGLDWSKVDRAVGEYEEFRYGGGRPANSEYGEILLLAKKVGRLR